MPFEGHPPLPLPQDVRFRPMGHPSGGVNCAALWAKVAAIAHFA